MGTDGTARARSGAVDADVDPDNPSLQDPDTDFGPPSELSEAEARSEAESLRDAIRYYDSRYYVLNDPAISDPAYDRLFECLETLEDQFDIRTEQSPTAASTSTGDDTVPSISETLHRCSLTPWRIFAFVGNIFEPD